MSCHELPARPHPLPWWTWAGFIDRTRAARRIDAECVSVEKTLPLRYVCPADVRVTCLSGAAWITTDGDIRDVVLGAGQAHDAARGDRLFINGLPLCKLRFAPRATSSLQHAHSRQDAFVRVLSGHPTMVTDRGDTPVQAGMCIGFPAGTGDAHMFSRGDTMTRLRPGPAMPDTTIRPVAPADCAAWRPLWDGYNAFYGRSGDTALPESITESTWRRFLDPAEPVHALVAQRQGRLVGLAHYLFHRSMTRVEDVCYLSDLYTLPELRGQGVGRALIEGVCAQAYRAGVARVYWQTHESNAAGRLLYDQVARHHGFIVYSRDAKPAGD